jgi:hypothetical protein
MGRMFSKESHMNPIIRFEFTADIDVPRRRPAFIVGGILQENPFFIPPDQFLKIRERRASTERSGRFVN